MHNQVESHQFILSSVNQTDGAQPEAVKRRDVHITSESLHEKGFWGNSSWE